MSRMTTDETKREGAVSFETLRLYCRFVGSNAFVAFLVFMIWFFSIGEYGPDIWLSVWQEDMLNMHMNFYMSIWAAIMSFGLIVMALSRVGCAVASSRAATTVHGAVLRSLVQCPMSFFESTPSGRILNRFGEDQFVMDMPLGMLLEAVIIIVLKTVNSLVVILVSVPWVTIAVVVCLPIFWKIWSYQRPTIIEATRFHLMSKSPMFSAFEETLSGLSTLQAFGMEDRFAAKFGGAVDKTQSWLWTKMVAQTWSEQGLMLLVSILVATAASCIVLMRDTVLPSVAALGLIYVIILAEFLRFIFGMCAQAESSLAVVERAQEILNTPHEAARALPADGAVQMPKPGAAVVFKDVVFRYRPHLDPALNGVSFAIAPGEHVGIVGRSGSGKSTLLTALLRLVEISSGEILIGPYKAEDLGLRLLRQIVTIIPQDPVMFSGSVRWNLDPASSFNDEAIRLASSRCGIVDMRPTFSLEEEVKENGSNFSVGERQLMCFARALLRCNPVMLFDEATASIDVENDARLQRVLREDFKGCTILTVAHRLGTIADSDRILALSKGHVAEFDTPSALMRRKQGIFAGLAREAGLVLPTNETGDKAGKENAISV
uniref:Uncharacterized protein n=1 Tax=Alexandrium catenella TaxID=2925 RepID=A0A7S1S6A7_ALECA